MKLLIIVIAVFGQTLLVSSSVIPKRFPPSTCSRSLPNYKECMLAYFDKIKPYIINGVPEWNIPSFNPLQVDELVINRTVSEQMSFSTKMENVRMWGFDELQVIKFDFDPEDLEGEFTIRIPFIKTKTEYDMVANLFGGEIINSGKFKAYTTNIVINFYVRLNTISKSGIEYFALENLRVKSKIGDCEVKISSNDAVFQPVFDRLIAFYNQDHQRVIRMMEPQFDAGALNYIRPVIDNLLSTIPADELIPE